MMRIGLLGLGTVGSAVARRLLEEPRLLADRAGCELSLAAVAVRDPSRERELDLPGVRLGGDAAAVAADPGLDIVVEVMGGMQPALDVMEAALEGGRAVVTANKAVLAGEGPRLAALAAARGGPLLFEAAVGGAVPVVGVLRGSLRGDRIRRLDAVINGTCNAVLDRMAEGVALDAALREARAAGYAEADPSADIDGEDAAAKLRIMAWLAMGARVPAEQVAVSGIRELAPDDILHARRLGHSVRLVASVAEMPGAPARLSPGSAPAPAGLDLRVRPALVPLSHPLASVRGAGNAVLLEGDLAGPVLLAGAGAGGEPTASAVVSDIVAAAREVAAARKFADARKAAGADVAAARGLGPGRGERAARPANLPAPSPEEAETAAYLRLEVGRGGEAEETVALMLEDRGVPVEGMARLEGAGSPGGAGSAGGAGGAGSAAGEVLLVLTAAAPRAVLDRALETLDTLPVVHGIAARLDRLTERA